VDLVMELKLKTGEPLILPGSFPQLLEQRINKIGF